MASTAATGIVAWTKAGAGALNSVEINGLWWPGFYDGTGGNATTLTTTLAISGANTLGVTYSVSFNLMLHLPL